MVPHVKVVPRNVGISADDSKLRCDVVPVGYRYSAFAHDEVCADEQSRVPIRVRAHVMSIQAIDTVSQTFDAKIWIQMKWLRKRANDVSEVQRRLDVIDKEGDDRSEWVPRMEFQDAHGDSLKVETRAVAKNYECNGYTSVYHRWVVSGTFGQRFRLEHFPLDHQQLHIRAIDWSSPHSVEEAGSEPKLFSKRLHFFQGSSCVYEESFVQRDAWNLKPKVSMDQFSTVSSRNDFGHCFTGLSIYVAVERKVNFYIWNVIFPVFSLVLLSFVSFFMDEAALSDRMSITLTILLTLVALKITVSSFVPATSYITYLDTYVLASFFILILVAGQNLICDKINDPHTDSQFSTISSWIIFATFLVWNIVALLVYLSRNQPWFLGLQFSKDDRIPNKASVPNLDDMAQEEEDCMMDGSDSNQRESLISALKRGFQSQPNLRSALGFITSDLK